MNTSMSIEGLNEAIVEEIDTIFEDLPDFKISQTVNTFLQLVKYEKFESITEGLNTRYVDNKFDKFKLARMNLVNSIEGYLKLIYTRIDGSSFNGTMSNCLEKFFMNQDPAFWRVNKSKFLTSTQDPNPKEDFIFFKSLTFIGDKIKLIYDLRNAFAHGKSEIQYPSQTKNLNDNAECVNDIKDCVCVYLYVTHAYLEQLSEHFEQQDQHDFTLYLNQLKQTFRNRIQRFVHLEGKEDLDLSVAYVIEQIDQNDDEVPERRGTVDNLRKEYIPEKRMMLWGEAGMGKTTTLEYLAYHDAEAYLENQSSKIPVYIPLGLTTDKNISLKQYIFNKLNIEPQMGDSFLEKGNINLFLDAVNEIPQDDNNQLKTYRQREIQNLISNCPKTFIIITNRPQDDNIFSDIPVFMLQKMDDAQINIFLEKNAGSPNIQRQIQNSIKENSRLKDIIKTPFMLSRLIEVVKRNGSIPTNKGDIIHEFIHELYSRERIEKKDANFNQKVIHRLLRHLGYESLEKKGTNAGLSEDYILDTFATCRNQYGFQIDLVYVLEVSTQLGILEKYNDLYTFSHQEYQDYYHFEEEKALFESL